MSRQSSGGPILVVEDDDSVRGAVDAALTAEGYEVVTAADGVAAMAAVGVYTFVLILLDMRMPRMDGPAFADAYAGIPGWHAPTVVLSAQDDAPRWAERIGAKAWLDKPFDLEKLLAVVARYAGKPTRFD